MSLNETGKLIEETRKIIETGQDGPNNMDLLNMILKVVTNIDSRVKGMETKLDKRIDDLHQSMLSVSTRVRTLEAKTSRNQRAACRLPGELSRQNPTPQNQEPVPTEIQREGSGENTGYRDVLMTPSNDTQNGRYKRQRAGSSPETPH
ncbi:Hypothetical predicted protein [Mytilus galloprovincialis]|uniref:Uncharacterized protein n=1 Tax=Mytilus galloprovincialis TaxID=29158 RepID=A0A8B6BGG2_MYTGA|nr:Hypothetical predicted protein [Mytilus galloprovincialis]